MKKILVAGGLCGLLVAAPQLLRAADHIDGPGAEAEPAADITDLYAWMNTDASKLNLVMNVGAFGTSQFSDAVQYVFHVQSGAGYDPLNPAATWVTTLVLCEFDADAKVRCWVGDKDYLPWSDASDPAGATSASGMTKVFAGPRNDPFFFELVGFNNAVKFVVDNAAALAEAGVFNEFGCPDLDEAQSAALVGLLTHGADGADASDTFAGADIASLVVQLDKSLVTAGGNTVRVWASTRTKPE